VLRLLHNGSASALVLPSLSPRSSVVDVRDDVDDDDDDDDLSYDDDNDIDDVSNDDNDDNNIPTTPSIPTNNKQQPQQQQKSLASTPQPNSVTLFFSFTNQHAQDFLKFSTFKLAKT
jgi:hypothetical protein